MKGKVMGPRPFLVGLQKLQVELLYSAPDVSFTPAIVPTALDRSSHIFHMNRYIPTVAVSKITCCQILMPMSLFVSF